MWLGLVRPRTASAPRPEVSGRAGPELPRGHRAEHDRAGTDLRTVPHQGVWPQGGAHADPGVTADGHGAHVQDVAVEPVAGQVDFEFDGRSVAEGQEACNWWHGVQVDVAPDAGAKQARV